MSCVTGSLQIKCDAISGGGSASASFVDMKKFKESDINYFIQVRVTNQRIGNPNLTEFDPIPDLPDTEFARVYGDSFISGFTEGGEFNALVSIKLNDHTKDAIFETDLIDLYQDLITSTGFFQEPIVSPSSLWWSSK